MHDLEDGQTPEAPVLERIAKLEGRLDTEQQSLTRRLGQWMALLALVISIAVGMFQVYETTVLRERDQIAADRLTLGSYVQRLTQIRADLINVFSSAPATVANDLAQTLNTERRSILGLADYLLSKQKETASYAVFFALSMEHLYWGNITQARKYAESALKLATTDVDRIEAQRITAGIWFVKGEEQNIPRAREIYNSAIREIELIQLYSKAHLFGNVYRDWIINEVIFGDCQMAKEVFQQFEETLGKERDEEVLMHRKSQIFAAFSRNEGCQLF